MRTYHFFAVCAFAIFLNKFYKSNENLSLVLSIVVLCTAFYTIRFGEEFQEEKEEEEAEIKQEEKLEEVITIPKVEEVPQLVVSKIPSSSEIAKLHQLFSEDRPFEAIDELKRLRSTNSLDDAKLTLDDKTLIEKVETASQEILRLTDLLENKEIWKLRSTHRKCEIYASTKDKRDFKVVCPAPESSLYDLISFIYETDLYSNWLPGCSQSARLKKSTFYQNLYLRFHLPFPLSDRDVVMKGYGDVWQGNKVMIYIGSIESPEAEKEMKIKKGASRVDVVFAGMLLKPLPGGGAELTSIARLDLKLSFVSDSVLDTVTKFILADLAAMLRDMSKDLGKNPKGKKNAEYIRRQVGEDSQVYSEIQKRLSQLRHSDTTTSTNDGHLDS